MPPDTDWHHYSIEFTDPTAAEHTAAHDIAPGLDQAEDGGQIDAWWYLRKTPAWRLRFQPTAADPGAVETLMSDLTANGRIANWRRGIYEPETLAFGGPAAISVAHTLFHHDSRHVLARVAENPPARLGRRETTVLLFSAMLRAAGLDCFEQGDVWAKITRLRPAPCPEQAPGHADRLAVAIRRLMTVDPRSVPDLIAPPWLDAFTTAGQQLAALARAGRLRRGLRAVLAHHFIFHANRAGLSGADQATLAALATDTVFHATTSTTTKDCDDNYCQ